MNRKQAIQQMEQNNADFTRPLVAVQTIKGPLNVMTGRYGPTEYRVVPLKDAIVALHLQGLGYLLHTAATDVRPRI